MALRENKKPILKTRTLSFNLFEKMIRFLTHVL